MYNEPTSKILYISEYEILSIKQVIKILSLKYHFTVYEDKNREIFIQDNFYAPSDYKFKLIFENTDYIEFNLGKTTRMNAFYENMYCMECTYTNNEKTNQIINEIKNMLKTHIPEKFISLEHFIEFCDKASEINLLKLPETLLPNVFVAIDELFSDFKAKECVHYTKSLNESDRPETLRIETKENQFSYVSINDYKIYVKNNDIFAIGIKKQLNNFHLVMITKTKNSKMLTEKFNKDFEKILYKDMAINGGKFTGDQKIIKLKEKFTLDDIALDKELKDRIKKEIFNFFKLEPVYKKAGIPFKRGIALYGPPGTGKTMIAKIIASTFKQTVIWVKAGDIESIEDMNRVFRLARYASPSVIILEDIDFYTEDRNSPHANKLGVATLMGHLDGLEENDGVLIVFTTNRIENIEKAIIDRPGRIDTQIFMGELGTKEIVQILDRRLGKFPRDFNLFTEVLPSHSMMTGALAVELSTVILRYSIINMNDAEGEILITETAVKNALKYIERLQNKSLKLGFKV